jgi:hypothetical protein
MRRLTFGTLLFTILLASCKKSDTPFAEPAQPGATETTQAITKRNCGAYEVLQRQMAEDPTLRQRMEEIEGFTRRAQESGALSRLSAKGAIQIPVVVHVLYNTDQQNISDAQVQSQITVLNEDFKSSNRDIKNVPRAFGDAVSPGMNVNFTLSQSIHKYTKIRSFPVNDAMKYSNRGGDDAVDPAHYLNVWVCNLGQNLLGYAQFPGGNPATDGVVILYSAFGSRAKYGDGTYIHDYDLGRTATHEIGHWLNLRHIWGDDGGACSGTDYVADTPNQGGENYGCPTFPHVSCSNGPTGDMFMNYMDYTDDACMFMFSEGQKARAEAVFVSGGPRASFVQ